MTTPRYTAKHKLRRHSHSRWVTRLSRETERRVYFYATVILLAAWATTRIW